MLLLLLVCTTLSVFFWVLDSVFFLIVIIFKKNSLCPCWRLGFLVVMLCSDMYLTSFVESDSSSTRITMLVISPQFYFGGENEFNSKSMETSEFASQIATVWGNGWSCNPKSSKSFLRGLLLFQAMGEVAFPRAVRDISFLMNLQGVKLQSNSSRRSSNLFMNCCISRQWV